MLVMIRNAYGALTVVLTGGTFVLVSWLAGPQVQAAFAYAVVWFLLLGGVRPAFELQAKRRRGGAGDSDADQLSRLTHVPAGLWLFLFHAVSLCALLGGGRWLLEAVSAPAVRTPGARLSPSAAPPRWAATRARQARRTRTTRPRPLKWAHGPEPRTHTALWPAPHASGAVDATVHVPGSKSVTNRALVLAALASEPGWLRRPLRSRDTLLMAGALRAMGVGIEERRRARTAPARPGASSPPACAARPRSTSATRAR